MRYLLLVCLLSAGCTINRPLEYESTAVQALCAARDGESVTVSHGGKSETVTLNLVPSWDELYGLCGKTGGACVNLNTNEIYIVEDRRCEMHASHELAHVFGVAGLDAYRPVVRRSERSY